MTSCVQCGTDTNRGQFYRFYYGVVVDEPAKQATAEGKSIPVDPMFRVRGSEEVYYCDDCLVRDAMRKQWDRCGLSLILALFTMIVLVLVGLNSTGGAWVCGVILLLLVARGVLAFRTYRQLQSALIDESPTFLRQTVSSNPNMQETGDAWAIAHRREALTPQGAELFVTRSENDFWSQD